MDSGEVKELATDTIINTEPEQNHFKQFDISVDYSDHHYAKSNLSGCECFNNAGSNATKSITREWKILQKNLPESIYVRVYEQRIDLLSAVIVGPAGTPYHDGLFFFDILFPISYPNDPPLVYYHSHGLRLNPNLHANGLVCLSLLNTWVGRKEEKWNPSESTILQVLLSLQALVLNQKPFYNEPGLQSLRESDSRNYNNEVFVLSCKTMTYILRKPPKNFEGFVKEHFRGRASFILGACKAYMKGSALVGGYQEYSGSNSETPSIYKKESKHFKSQMGNFHFALKGAFTKNAPLDLYLAAIELDRNFRIPDWIVYVITIGACYLFFVLYDKYSRK
ncbi:putative Ubiquitin conjugating enzyme [Quillaja saponaria]|uniref:Ubiquitin conjugating enzyme n=1 Tax=Quillaja saponaria TaxID=32244 RepID=A0AAD7PHR1_QUISA|nr:putative Ubiquitin conjugating enzyme [Quillaja saponaria]